MIAAAFAAGPALAQDLTGTLKKIKDTGTITHRPPRLLDPVLLLRRQAAGRRLRAWTSACKIVDAVKTELKMPKLKVKYSTRSPRRTASR